MPDEKQAPYSLAHKQRQPYTGTDPKKILKSDTQHIDKNVYDPYDKDYSHRAGAPEPVKTV
jgi:hypothetical protein